MKFIKECLQMIKKWFTDPLVRNTIILSTLFALIIHILFSITAPCDFLVGKWGAGDILTYVSTIALGILAVWQNKKFKEENDSAQARLEKLTIQANELSVISKIVEYETANYEELRKASQAFDEALDFYTVLSELQKKGETEMGRQTALLYENHKIQLAAQELWDVIDDDLRLCDRDKDAIEKPLDDIVAAAEKVIQAMQAELSNPEDHSFAGALADFETAFTNYRLAMVEHLTKAKIKYEQLIYGNLSLQEIKELYGYPIRRTDKNGKNENGIR